MLYKENLTCTKAYGAGGSPCCTYTLPKYKVAVASSDGKVVNRHFGHSKQFIVFEVDAAGKWSFNEIRITDPICSNGEHKASSMQQAVELLSDCKVVLVSQIGIVAEQALKAGGVLAYSISDFIDTALAKVIKRLSSDEVF